MEVSGQLRPIVPDAGALFAETLDDVLRRTGVGPAGSARAEGGGPEVGEQRGRLR
ncbi:hypothetical protein SAMN06893096_10373 [Geodermatophilus pulveris]|uniref:Uncharacterized protein n=1 Tax=Geodermatophilus pulveris TaxID=1564159 RepID=A0A239DAY7_9ACTN|nr:hypothetical protein [Geodermatophilus pulveris]SNS28853.1 hypothetical protein SAMN06893096_10373 [Geodermatophilus pulveris]